MKRMTYLLKRQINVAGCYHCNHPEFRASFFTIFLKEYVRYVRYESKETKVLRTYAYPTYARIYLRLSQNGYLSLFFEIKSSIESIILEYS